MLDKNGRQAQIMAWLLDGTTGILKLVIGDSLLRHFSPMNEQALLPARYYYHGMLHHSQSRDIGHNKNLMPAQNGNKIDIYLLSTRNGKKRK